MIALIIIGAFFGLIIAYLVVIVFSPVLKEHSLPIPGAPEDRALPPDAEAFAFKVDGDTLRGTYYLPESPGDKLTCVVMSHGFGGTRDFALPAYAERFTAAGFAVLTYDYRHFGDSDGEPRQWWNGRRQLDDIRGVVSWARNRPEVDPGKIVLWGTSGGAPYGFLIAAEDDRIAGIISQVGGLDHKEDEKIYNKREGWKPTLRAFIHGQRDKGRSRFGLPVHHIPIVGPPDSVAILTAPGAYDGYAKLAAVSRTFRNELAARTMLTMPPGSPVDAAPGVSCPVLVIVAEKDNLASPRSHVLVVEGLKGKAKVVSYPIDHFEVYSGDWFEKAVGEMTGFLQEVADSTPAPYN